MDIISVRSTYLTEMATRYTRQQLRDLAVGLKTNQHPRNILHDFATNIRSDQIKKTVEQINNLIYKSAENSKTTITICVIKSLFVGIVTGVRSIYPNIRYRRHDAYFTDKTQIIFDWSD